MKTSKQLKVGLLSAAIFLSAATLCAEVVTWSGTAQSVSANTEIETLHVTAATTVTIADGCSLTVDELVGDAAITKAGEGTLIVRNFSANSQITATTGVVRFAAGGPTDTTVFDSDGTFYHADASVAASLTTAGVDAEGRTLVSNFADVRGASRMSSSNAGYDQGVTYNMPWIESGALNGLNVLDFGSYWVKDSLDGYGAALTWDRSSSAIREVLIVYSDAHGSHSQCLLGCKVPVGDNNAKYNYRRDYDTGALFSSMAAKNVRTGSVYVDGALVSYSDVLPAGFHVIRLVQAGTTTASAFADDRHDRRGGMQLAEAIALTVQLDAVSSRRLEMRLQQKWLPKSRTIASLSLSGEASLTVDEGVKFMVMDGSLAETATVTGSGEAQFRYSEGGYSYPAKSIVKVTESQRVLRATAARRIRVEQGLLSIATTASKLTPALHLDATSDDSFSYLEDEVRYWYDIRVAKSSNAKRARQDNAGQRPMRIDDGQNGLPIVDFGDIKIRDQRHTDSYVWIYNPSGYGARWMSFQNITLSKIRDVFMVVADTDAARSQVSYLGEEGQYFLCDSSKHDFHRDGLQLLSGSDGCGKDDGTTTALDGVPCQADTILPGGFHLVRISPEKACTASRLCKDRGDYRWGGLKYGEILIYEGAKLSDDEAADVSAYLLNKWGLPNASGKGVAYESLEVAEGATLALPVFSSAAELIGAGTVRGDLTLEEDFILKVTVGMPLTVTGKLAVPAKGTIEISGNADDFEFGDVVTLVHAGAMENVGRLRWTVTGSFANSRKLIRVFADAGGLKARIVSPGLNVILR